jgi:hypothetical protein
MWDLEMMAGSVPTLFAEDVDTSKEALADDVAKPQGDMAEMYRAFFMPEHIPLSEVMNLRRRTRLSSLKKNIFTKKFSLRLVNVNLEEPSSFSREKGDFIQRPLPRHLVRTEDVKERGWSASITLLLGFSLA